MNQTAPIRFVGDMHIGRTPHRLADFGIDVGSLAPATAWHLVVDHAMAHDFAVVVFAGDVVDQSRDRWEAYAQLENGAQRLADHGIPLVGEPATTTASSCPASPIGYRNSRGSDETATGSSCSGNDRHASAAWTGIQ